MLFADEPTTGLDSFMAISIVECIKNLAKSGKTIIFTIHQPSSELFEMFDQICLMSEGRLAFLGSRMMAAKFFENQGFKSPQNYNPADHFIKTLSISPVDKDKSLGDIAVSLRHQQAATANCFLVIENLRRLPRLGHVREPGERDQQELGVPDRFGRRSDQVKTKQVPKCFTIYYKTM